MARLRYAKTLDMPVFGFGLLGEMIAGLQEETREMARTLARLDKLDVRD